MFRFPKMMFIKIKDVLSAYAIVIVMLKTVKTLISARLSW